MNIGSGSLFFVPNTFPLSSADHVVWSKVVSYNCFARKIFLTGFFNNNQCFDLHCFFHLWNYRGTQSVFQNACSFDANFVIVENLTEEYKA